MSISVFINELRINKYFKETFIENLCIFTIKFLRGEFT